MFNTIHQHHLGWNPDQNPATTIAPGDKLELSLLDASGNRVRKDSPASIIPTLLPENANPLTGPVYIDNAEPGDTLVVHIHDFSHAGWGWTALFPGFGLLAEDFVDPFLHISEYSSDQIRFTDTIIIPTRPFAGTIGTCPSPHLHLPAIPPHQCGGNMDFSSLVAGSTLYLPVKVAGALFSVGDGHAAQGDGEVCGTAIETCLSIQVSFNLLKNQEIPQPRAETPISASQAGKQLVTMGIGPDLRQCCADAVRFMIDELGQRYALEPALAYCLISSAADLHIAQLVNAPNWTVVCKIPQSTFR